MGQEKSELKRDPKTGWVLDPQRSNCANCKRKFTRNWWRKHHCRDCKDLLCSDCCPSPGFFSSAKRICSDKISCKKRQEAYERRLNKRRLNSTSSVLLRLQGEIERAKKQ